MGFMKACRAARYQDYADQGGYVDYKKMKLVLHQMKDAKTRITPEEAYNALVSQIKIVYDWCAAKVEELTRVAEVAAADVVTAEVFDLVQRRRALIGAPALPPRAERSVPATPPTPSSPAKWRRDADAIVYELLRFQECRNLNDDIVERVVGREQRYTILPQAKKWRSIASEPYDFRGIAIDEIFYFCDVLYEAAREAERAMRRGGEGGAAHTAAGEGSSQTFERRSVKYWVHLQDLPFVTARIIRHLPISTFKDMFPEHISKKMEEYEHNRKQPSTATFVTAPPSPMKGNGGRGAAVTAAVAAPAAVASSTRCQDASESADPAVAALSSLRQPTKYTLGQAISSVYFDSPEFLCYHRRLERLEGSSLFRIRWYGGSSSESRHKFGSVVPPDQDVFMELKVHHEAWMGEKSTKRRFPLKCREVNSFLLGELPLNKNVKKLAAKGAKPADVEKFKQLSTEIYAKIQSWGLHPVMRTSYTRAAFQKGLDQTVRVSIDTDLRFTAEDFGAAKNWHYAGFDEMIEIGFPYAVVEVKLQCAENERIPPWIEELLQCSYMEPVPKFSKYGHGVCSLFGHTPRVHLRPYWFHQVDAEIRAARKPANDPGWDPVQGLAVGCWERLTDAIVFGRRGGQTKTVGASEAAFLSETNHHRTYCALAGRSPLRDENGHAIPDFPLSKRHVAFLANRPYFLEDAPTEASCVGAAARGTHEDFAVQRPQTLDGKMIPWQSGKRVHVPQRVDPKTLLAAERQFLKWVKHGVSLGIVGLAMIHYGGTSDAALDPAGAGATDPDVRRSYYSRRMFIATGTIVVVLAVAAQLYALIVMHARSRRVFAQKKIRYDDITGPTVLTLFLVAALLLVGMDLIMQRFGSVLFRAPVANGVALVAASGL